MPRLVIATRNDHKVAEIQAMLGGGFVCESLRQYPAAPPAVEDGATFADNARKKAASLAAWLSGNNAGIPPVDLVLADDSGLEVDALDGAPGVHSARFAALDAPGNAPDADNNDKLLRLLAGVPPARRTARFRCVLVVLPIPRRKAVDQLHAAADLEPAVFEGICEGIILDAARGQHGFGYDPLFVPAGQAQTFAELGDELKNRISHRSRALELARKTLAKVLPG